MTTLAKSTLKANQDNNFSSFVELLRFRAQKNPDFVGYEFLLDGDLESHSLTYRELDNQAKAIACQLLVLASPGERALLLYPSGLEFIAGFFGCLYAGIIGIPVDVPRANQSLDRLSRICLDAGATLALTTEVLATQLRQRSAGNAVMRNLSWIATDHLSIELCAAWQEQDLNHDTLAFLQYTSGSTGLPKGVMVSHGNLLHNEALIKKAFQHDNESIIFGWLPLFHDMGLIGNILQPLYIGRPCILMSPIAFIQKPLRWLSAISRYKVTSSGGPNFAYELCARKITPEQKHGIDLSSWHTAFNGAEPIRTEVLEQFANCFAECGFNRKAFLPCYGLAEATLFVCGNLRTIGPLTKSFQAEALEHNQAKLAENFLQEQCTLVSCSNSDGQKIKIVNPENFQECLDNQIGEIWLSGPSVAQGYWNNLEATDLTFRARLEKCSETYLRTGDLGFLNDGQLYVTGRLKDLIIIRGRNYYPQDIEFTIEQCHPSIRPNCTAAFTVAIEGEERLVILTELERQVLTHHRRSTKNSDQASKNTFFSVDYLFSAIRQAVSKSHDLQVYGIVLLKPGAILKTSSGKIQRQACRGLYETENLNWIDRWEQKSPPYQVISQENPLELKAGLNLVIPSNRYEEFFAYLEQKTLQILGFIPIQTIASKTSLLELGFDSLTTMELHVAIEKDLNTSLPVSKLLENPTIEEIVLELVETCTFESLQQISVNTNSDFNNDLVKGTAELTIPPPRNHLSSILLALFWKMSKVIWNIQVSGSDNIPSSGPFILCSNHESHLDSFWITSCLPSKLRDQCCCLAKKEHFQTAIGRVFTHLMGAIATDRNGDGLPALKKGIAVLQQLRPLLIHPEGTRTRTGKLLPFRRGISKLAFATNTPVIPIKIIGAGVIFPPDKLIPSLFDWSNFKRFELQIIFGPPIALTAKEHNLAEENQFTEGLQNAVASLAVERSDNFS